MGRAVVRELPEDADRGETPAGGDPRETGEGSGAKHRARSTALFRLSLRAGFVTEAGIRGTSDNQIIEQTGHRQAATVRKYFRNRNIFRGNASAILGL